MITRKIEEGLGFRVEKRGEGRDGEPVRGLGFSVWKGVRWVGNGRNCKLSNYYAHINSNFTRNWNLKSISNLYLPKEYQNFRLSFSFHRINTSQLDLLIFFL